MPKRMMFIQTILTVALVFYALPVLAEMIVDTAWVRRYDEGFIDRANAIAVDDSGNVCVTGYSMGAAGDYATLKYYPNGDTAWLRRYDAPVTGDDEANAIAVDGAGDVYVTGNSSDYYGTIRYDFNGDTVWVRRYGEYGTGNRAYAIAVDGLGNVYVTGHTMVSDLMDYGTIKYYPDGDTAWVRTYDGNPAGSSPDAAFDIAVDSSGNVYVTGCIGFLVIEDYTTIKYYANGDTAWVRKYNGPLGGSRDWAHAIAVDHSGNVFVTGHSTGSDTTYDYATIKYDPNGDTAWVRRYSGPGIGKDSAYEIAADDSGNVYVTGESQGDYATIKYDRDGNTLWVRRYNGPANGNDFGLALAIDDSNNVYVTGGSEGSGTGEDYATIKYSANGDSLWAVRYNGTGNGDDGAEALAVDDNGNVYVTGQSVGDNEYSDYATIKYFQALRGDVNRDWLIELGDAIYLLNYLFRSGTPPEYLVIGNCNCDETVDLDDAIYLLNYLFRGGQSPDCL